MTQARISPLTVLATVLSLVVMAGCGSKGGDGDADEDSTPDTSPDTSPDTTTDLFPDTEPDTSPDPAPDSAPDTAPDSEPDTAPDSSPDLADGVEWDGSSGYYDHLGTNNQSITGVTRVIFLGDSITATPYLTPPWSDRIRDDLQALFGSGTEFRNYAVWGAQTDDVLNSQLLNIDTASTKPTLVMFTIGGNDALEVIGEDIPTSLAYMETRVDNLRAILEWLFDPTHFPGGVYVVYGNVYDPTDGEGDFTHCGVATSYGDWPECNELATIVNGWYLDLAIGFGADVLNMHDLFLGHGWNNSDPANPYYCLGCTPTCPCPRWFDATCIHPSNTGHEALAGFFRDIVAR